MADTQERLFTDERNPETPVPESQIKREYGQHVADGSIDPSEQTFEQYLVNCMASNGGTLSVYEPTKEKKPEFTFLVRETYSLRVTVEADTYESALDIVQRNQWNGEYDVDQFDGAEFRPLCQACESDFDEDNDALREVNGGTPLAMMLCDRCVADMEDSGELTRCESCGNVFSPSRLIINPENGEREICPDCGLV